MEKRRPGFVGDMGLPFEAIEKKENKTVEKMKTME
jgi:hypothetical protein